MSKVFRQLTLSTPSVAFSSLQSSGLTTNIIFDMMMTLRGSQLEHSGDGQSEFDLPDTIGVCTDTGH